VAACIFGLFEKICRALFHDAFRVSAESKKSQSICYKLFSFYSLTFFCPNFKTLVGIASNGLTKEATDKLVS